MKKIIRQVMKAIETISVCLLYTFIWFSFAVVMFYLMVLVLKGGIIGIIAFLSSIALVILVSKEV